MGEGKKEREKETSKEPILRYDNKICKQKEKLFWMYHPE